MFRMILNRIGIGQRTKEPVNAAFAVDRMLIRRVSGFLLM